MVSRHILSPQPISMTFVLQFTNADSKRNQCLFEIIYLEVRQVPFNKVEKLSGKTSLYFNLMVIVIKPAFSTLFTNYYCLVPTQRVVDWLLSAIRQLGEANIK